MFHATVIQDTMPVSLVVSNPTSMPVYNSVDLDEVQPLARYCFSFISTSRTLFFLSISFIVVCKLMYRFIFFILFEKQNNWTHNPWIGYNRICLTRLWKDFGTISQKLQPNSQNSGLGIPQDTGLARAGQGAHAKHVDRFHVQYLCMMMSETDSLCVQQKPRMTTTPLSF